MYLSRSAFLVSFTDPNKQSFNVKSVFKLLKRGISYVRNIYIYYFLGTEILLFIKQCPLKSNTLWLTKVGAKFLSDLVIFSSNISLDIHE